MLRKAICIMVMLLTLPAMASAYNCWSVTKSVTPTTQVSTVTPPANSAIPGYSTAVGSTTTNMTATASTTCSAAPQSATFTIAAPGGYTLSSVKIDNVAQALGTTYTVNHGTQISHTIAVSYATANFVITTTPAAGGTISSSVQVASGGSATINITPNTGYQLTGVNIDGTNHTSDATFTGVQSAGSYTFTNVTAAHSLTATFAVVPSLTASISNPGGTVAFSSTTLVDGSGSTSNVSPTTYGWTTTCGTITPTGSNAKTANFVAPSSASSCTVTLTVSASGATTKTATATFATVSALVAADNACNVCHKNDLSPQVANSPALIANFAVSAHGTQISCQACHTDANANTMGSVKSETISPKTFNNLSSAADNGVSGAKGNFCSRCHNNEVSGFFGSTHWTSATGAAVPDMISHGTNCTQTCHFRNANAPSCNTCHAGTLNPDGTSNVAQNHLLVSTTAAATCMVCHTGSHHGVTTSNWTNSTHNIANNGFENISCDKCHDPHSTVATATDDKTDSCSACHVYRDATHNYSIYTDATLTTLKAPHGGGSVSPTTTQYVTQGAICIDCHGHDNTINAGYADSAHGKVTSGTGAFGTEAIPGNMTNNGTRTNSNCQRCHSTYGFLKFTNQTTGLTRLQPKVGQPNNVLLCITCHAVPGSDTTQAGTLGWGGTGTLRMPEGTLSLNVTPTGNPVGALSNGYFALFSTSSASVA